MWIAALRLSIALAPMQEGAVALDAGPLQLEVHVSETAHLFHVVDQLSDWSPFCHGQYARGLGELDDTERALLEEHRGVRARRAWGQGLEQALYSPLPLDEALEQGVARGWIDAEDAEVERRVLDHFRQRVRPLMDAEAERLAAFRARIVEELPALRSFAVPLEGLVGAEPAAVPVYLIANPADYDMGGGFNGGRLTLEVPRAGDAFPTFLHELFHVFLDLRREDMQSALERAAGKGPDLQTLYEGITHAVSPGLIHAGAADSDPLAEAVTAARLQGRGLDDYDARVHRYGLALRPLVRELLESEEPDFDDLIERSIEIWRAVAELGLAD